jgi:hypothetical protein
MDIEMRARKASPGRRPLAWRRRSPADRVLRERVEAAIDLLVSLPDAGNAETWANRSLQTTTARR